MVACSGTCAGWSQWSWCNKFAPVFPWQEVTGSAPALSFREIVMPQNQTYTNLYMVGFLATFGMVLFGVYYFYAGMGEVSYRTYSGFDTVTYYLDKQKYDLYLNGLVYCASFAAAMLLLTAAILVPSQAQLQRRQAQTHPYGTQLHSTALNQPAPAVATPEQVAVKSEPAAPVPTMDLEPEFELSVDDSFMDLDPNKF